MRGQCVICGQSSEDLQNAFCKECFQSLQTCTLNQDLWNEPMDTLDSDTSHNTLEQSHLKCIVCNQDVKTPNSLCIDCTDGLSSLFTTSDECTICGGDTPVSEAGMCPYCASSFLNSTFPGETDCSISNVHIRGPDIYGSQSSDDEGDENFTFTKTRERVFGKNSATQITYKINLNQEWEGKKFEDAIPDLKRVFDAVLREVKRDADVDHDLGNVIIHHSEDFGDIIVPLRNLLELDAENVMQTIENTTQSHKDLQIEQTLDITVGVIRIPRGAGNDIPSVYTLSGPENACTMKKSVITVNNNDVSCMYQAIGISWVNSLEIVSENEWRNLNSDFDLENEQVKWHRMLALNKCSLSIKTVINHKNRPKPRRLLAQFLCQETGIDYSKPGDLTDLAEFETLLNRRILVLCNLWGHKFIRTEDNGCPPICLYLVRSSETDMGHFNSITSIPKFLGKKFCFRCVQPYTGAHKKCTSKDRCYICEDEECLLNASSSICCPDCNVTFRNDNCFKIHKEKGPKGDITKKTGRANPISWCNAQWKCLKCQKIMHRGKEPIAKHKCFTQRCNQCHEFVPENHLCYNRALKPSKELNKFHYIFLDFETSQNAFMKSCEKGYQPTANPDCCICRENDSYCKDCICCKNCADKECGLKEHRPNLAVIQTVCNYCHECTDDITVAKCNNCGIRCSDCRASETFCDQCGFREAVFKGEDSCARMCNELFTKRHRGATVFAHNGKGFDFHFVFRYMLENGQNPDVIYAGSKIMSMKCKVLNMTFLDSLNFLPMKLSALPKAFGLDQNLAKGYFPHFFNCEVNYNYKGPYPDPRYYGADDMSVTDRESFLKWHEQQTGVFDFAKEIVHYCRNDVSILRLACLKFRKMMVETTDVDPFRQMTIASTALAVWRTNCLHECWEGLIGSKWEDLILIKGKFYKGGEDVTSRVTRSRFVSSPVGTTPSSKGYATSDNFSSISLKWLYWVEEADRRKGITTVIQHALSPKGEYKVPTTNYKVDGYASNTVWEFHGCVFHGCPKCFPRDRDAVNIHSAFTLNQLYSRTVHRIREIESLGYRVIQMWECEFRAMIQRNEDGVADFISTLDLQDRLNPRDAFFGGRTNAIRLNVKASEGQKIHYVDFTSLYPSVLRDNKYPVGHPEIITRDFKAMDQYFGVAHVKILPPDSLFHPVLPYRIAGKLCFPLCRSCAKDSIVPPCKCSVEDRALNGTWCTPEILKAVDKGYQILKVYEVYHFPETTQYDPVTKEGGLFTSYINKFLKIKQEASGYPSDCNTEEERSEYIRAYEHHEGIKLDRDQIPEEGVNSGMRSLAKLLLNSLWGKFGQRSDMPKTTVFTSDQRDKLLNLVTDPTKQIDGIDIINNQVLVCTHKNRDPCQKDAPNTNIFLACFTTCYGRLKLYRELDKLGERVCYFDTDSLIYISEPGQFNLPLGRYLGELTSELPPGAWIEKFLSGGAKQYGYKVHPSGEIVLKLRGFSLNYRNSQRVNFDSLERVILQTFNENSDACIYTCTKNKIGRQKRTNKVTSRDEIKRYKPVYMKRCLMKPSLYTLPFGWK